MNNPESKNTLPPNTVLLEGEKDRRPRPEALVDWPKDRPPGGTSDQDQPTQYRSLPERQEQDHENNLRQKFLIKVAGLEDILNEIEEEPLGEHQLSWLSDQLNAGKTPLVINRPHVGSRKSKETELPIELAAGFITKGTAAINHQGPDGPGLYAEAQILPDWIATIQGIIKSPFGIDITAYYGESLISLDVVVQPKGTGKVIRKL